MAKKLISIRVSPETDSQIKRLEKMDRTSMTAVIVKAVEFYFNDRVDAEMVERLRGIHFETMKKGSTYLLEVHDDGTIEVIAPEEGVGKVER